MSPIRIGFIGLSNDGWAARSLFPPLLTPSLVQKYSLEAVSTTSSTSAAASAKKHAELTGHPVKPYHGDTTQIANDANVDLVAVSVKVPAHRRAALDALGAGKDLFIEWPLANGLAEALELAEAAKKTGVRTVVGLQGRQSPAVKKIKDLIASGNIGRVRASTVMGNVSFWGKTVSERNAYLVDAKNGAGLLEIAIGHFTDLFTWTLGDFVSVMASSQNQHPLVTLVDATGKSTGKTIPQTIENQYAFSGTLTSGAHVSMHWRGGITPTKGRVDFFWQIDGEDGVIRIESAVAILGTYEPKVYLNGEEIQITEETGELENTKRTWLEFSKGAEGSYPTIDDAVKNHRVIDAIGKSAKEGRRVDL